MADVFVSYARSDKARVAPLVAAIEAQGWSVWWDPAIATGQEFDDQIAAELKAASAVLVVWTPTSVESRWVRGEARDAAERGILVPVRFEGAACRSTCGRFIRPTSTIGARIRAVRTGAGGASRARHRDRAPARVPIGEVGRHIGAIRGRRRSSRRDLRPALRQHERRSGAGVLQRRHHRGHHHRPEQGLGAGSGLRATAPSCSRASTSMCRKSHASSRSATCWKAVCARPVAAYGSPPSWWTVRATITSGPSATTAT